LIVKGNTSKVIAKALGISDLTVRKHRENILRKLEIQNTAQLVHYWLHHGPHHEQAANISNIRRKDFENARRPRPHDEWLCLAAAQPNGHQSTASTS
jgi:hypothetical protein